MKSHIFQIYYSEESRKMIDSSFIPLDNSLNERADWREYWPIRNFLIENNLEKNTFYGFLSPKFNQKTKLNGAEIIEHHRNIAHRYKMINLSPYYDLSSFYQNTFEQASASHKDIAEKSIRCMSKIFPDLRISDLVMTVENTIFCNYFTAQRNFWIEWFYICEKIFKWAEDSSSELFEDLNAITNHGNELIPFKVFLIERIASILAITREEKIDKYNSQTPIYGATIFKYEEDHLSLMKLDSYKNSYQKTGDSIYLTLFSELRQEIISKNQ